MPINVPGLLLTKLVVEREDIPEDRQRQLMLIGGVAPFPLGVVVADLIARREAPTTQIGRADGGASGDAAKIAAIAHAREEAAAAVEAAKSAAEAAEAAEAASGAAAKAAYDAAEAARDAIREAAAIEKEWEEEALEKAQTD